MPKDKTKATEQKKPEAKSKSRAAAKAKAQAKPAKKTAAKSRRTTPNRPGKAAAKAQSKAKAKTASRPHTVAMAVPVDSVLVGAAVRSFQASVPAAMAVNSKLADIAHANMNAGLELARDLASAKTPMDAMRLGVSYWFSHVSAVQAQARELQGLSAAWVKTASEHVRDV